MYMRSNSINERKRLLFCVSFGITPFNARTNFRRQNLTSIDVRFIKKIIENYNGRRPITYRYLKEASKANNNDVCDDVNHISTLCVTPCRTSCSCSSIHGVFSATGLSLSNILQIKKRVYKVRIRAFSYSKILF